MATSKCFSWDETQCPQGFVRKDYSDPDRIDNIVVSPNLKVVRSDKAVLYKCPAGDHVALVVKNGKLDVKQGDTISSTQAEGVFKKVLAILKLGEETLFRI